MEESEGIGYDYKTELRLDLKLIEMFFCFSIYSDVLLKQVFTCPDKVQFYTPVKILFIYF